MAERSKGMAAAQHRAFGEMLNALRAELRFVGTRYAKTSRTARAVDSIEHAMQDFKSVMDDQVTIDLRAEHLSDSELNKFYYDHRDEERQSAVEGAAQR